MFAKGFGMPRDPKWAVEQALLIIDLDRGGLLQLRLRTQ